MPAPHSRIELNYIIMCGIFGYVGKTQKCLPLIIKGLKRLEYRGYDSAGLAVITNNTFYIKKKKGYISELEKAIDDYAWDIVGTGIAHTRWATHGEPSDINAHPHVSNSGKLAIVHNGIIENYHVLKELLRENGYHFMSQTDTEVLVNFIEWTWKTSGADLFESVRLALQNVHGAYAFLLLNADDPTSLIIGKKSSPAVIGVIHDTREYVVASDPTAIVEHTKEVIFIDDETLGYIQVGKPVKFIDLKKRTITPAIERIEMDVEQLERGGFPHFMLKEIYEQPETTRNSMRGRLIPDKDFVGLGGLTQYIDAIAHADYLTFLGCGTSYHACLIAKYVIEELAGIPVFVEHASEFRYRNPVIKPYSITFVVSQSGETMDTLQSVKLIKEKNGLVFGICNVVGSSIARETHAGSYTHAGPEIGVASTKAFTSQLAIIYLLALWIAQKKKTLEKSTLKELMHQLMEIPAAIERSLSASSNVKEIAHKYLDYSNFLFLGRRYNYPIALEGALKLKEISYVHAEGYPAGEMKHGPIALIDENMPCIVIVPEGETKPKILNNIIEIKARNGKVIAIATEGDTEVPKHADDVIYIPFVPEILSPFVSVIPLQLFAYHMAVLKGCNVDKPRNLAKSVTVE